MCLVKMKTGRSATNILVDNRGTHITIISSNSWVMTDIKLSFIEFYQLTKTNTMNKISLLVKKRLECTSQCLFICLEWLTFRGKFFYHISLWALLSLFKVKSIFIILNPFLFCGIKGSVSDSLPKI